jgi:hypothetical protein
MKRSLYIGIITVVIVLLGVGLIFFRDRGKNPETQAAALRQAQQFVPTGVCTQVITHAIHKKSGAQYTFMSGCLPPGWEPIKS